LFFVPIGIGEDGLISHQELKDHRRVKDYDIHHYDTIFWSPDFDPHGFYQQENVKKKTQIVRRTFSRFNRFLLICIRIFLCIKV